MMYAGGGGCGGGGDEEGRGGGIMVGEKVKIMCIKREFGWR